MPRGNGRHAQEAAAQSKLSAYIKPKDGTGQQAGTQEWVDWGEVSPSLLTGSIVSANKEGGALLFGHNRSRTCYAVTVFYGGTGTPYYFQCSSDGLEALEVFLLGIIELAQG